jgi:hypothetical protein
MKKILVTVALFVLAPVAGAFAAGGSTLSGYGGAAGTIQASVQKPSSLPFTGLNLAVVAVFAIGFLFVGLLLRRTRRAS